MKTIAKKTASILTFLTVGTVILVPFAISYDFQYESHGKRDPFVSLIGQEKNKVASLIDVTSPEDLKLEGIALGAGGKKTAIINGEMVKVGQKVGEIEIKKITANTVELLIGGKPCNLKLSEEGGLKSEQ